MKKIIYTIIIFFLLIPIIYAFTPTFQIDITKINISNKGDKIINNLEYKIDTKEFKNETELDEEVKTFTKKLVEISLADVSLENKQSELSKYIYIDSTDGSNTLTSTITIQTFVKEINKYDIKYDYIKIIRVIPFEKGILSFVYIPNANVSNEQKDIVLTFWLKKVNNDYKLYFPWVNLDDNLEEYFNNISKKEETGNNIGSTYKSINLNGQALSITEEELNKLYQENILSNVQISAINNGDTNLYASGFFIKEGIVVTTWSTFLEFLSNSDFIYINDSNGKTYNILGVVAASSEYDIVLLKIDEETGKPVKFQETNTLKLDDKLFTINSKTNIGFSINYGSFISLTNGKIKNFFALSSSDVGSALYNKDGYVVGFNTKEILYSELSSANSTDYIIKLQEILSKETYNNIEYASLETFKNNYYNNLKEEKVINNIPTKVWNKYKSIGNIEQTIKLPLIKSSYRDNIISLRYKNNAISSIDTKYLVSDFINNLEKDNYKLTYNKNNKKTYTNNKYKVIIKEDLDYLIILIMEE